MIVRITRVKVGNRQAPMMNTKTPPRKGGVFALGRRFRTSADKLFLGLSPYLYASRSAHFPPASCLPSCIEILYKYTVKPEAAECSNHEQALAFALDGETHGCRTFIEIGR